LVKDSVIIDPAGVSHTMFKVWQVQPVNSLNGLFKMPVDFEVHYRDGSFDRNNAWVEKQYTEVSVPNPGNKEIGYLLFDPGRRILKKSTFVQPFDRHATQALTAGEMIDRYDAWLSLRAEPVERKKEVLMDAFHREKFWLIKSEIMQQLASDHTPETVELFRQALKDGDANVRKYALLTMAPVPELLRGTVEQMLYDSSYLNVEYALESLCLSFPESVDYYLGLTRDMEGWRGKNIRIMWLAIALSHGQMEHLPELIAYCSPKFEFETRMNAFNLLKEMGYEDEETIRYAELAGKHWNNKLAGAARDYLKTTNLP
jgi:hypothetical protein